jgi:hypothetical protein
MDRVVAKMHPSLVPSTFFLLAPTTGRIDLRTFAGSRKLFSVMEHCSYSHRSDGYQ